MKGLQCVVCAAVILARAAEAPRAAESSSDPMAGIPGDEPAGGIGAAGSPKKRTTPRPRPRLIISTAGLRLEEPGKPEKRFDTAAELVREAPWVGGIFLIKGREAGKPAAEPTAGNVGKARRMVEGEIPMTELARFLADYTGLPVIAGSGASLATRSVLVTSTVDEADDEFVKRLLRANGILVTEEAVGLDERALFLDSADAAAAAAGGGEPEPRPIVVLDPDEVRTAAERRARRDVRQAKGPEPLEGMYHGLILSEVPEMLAAQLPIEHGRGVLVAAVDEKTLAAQRDLKLLHTHDVVTHLNGDTVDSPEEFQMVLSGIPPGAPLDVRVLRKGITRILRTERAR